MANSLTSFPSFGISEIYASYNSLTGYEKEESFSKRKQAELSGLETLGDAHSFCSEYGFYQENNPPGKTVNFATDIEPPFPVLAPSPQPIYSPGILSDFKFDPTFQSTNQSLPEIKEEEQSFFPLSSLELQTNFGSGVEKLKGEICSDYEVNYAGGKKLSTEEIMRVAGERFIQLSTQRVDNSSLLLIHPYGYAFSGLSFEETQDVELGQLLLAAAEKVGHQQFDSASRLLTHCEWLSAATGNPVQRVVSYFAGALRERIDRETGRFVSWKMEANENYHMAGSGTRVSSNLVLLKFHQELPFSQVMLFPGIQAILENIEQETKIHLIDLQIRSGVEWAVLMQALTERVSRPIENLKITTVGTKDREKMEETGKRLTNFAKSLNLPFSFEVVLLSDMKDLTKEHFHTEDGEAVVIYSRTILRSMISRPNSLENFMRVIRKLNPAIMVVIEVEANHNSPSFFNRFIEALFFYSALFDCLEEFGNRDNQHRFVLEGKFFGDGIHNIVAAEGEERVNRNVKMSVWRAFFARFGMVGVELSESTLYQANLIVKQFACGSSCTLENDGKCLIVGWKGTPIHSLSTWKFL